MQSDTGTGSGFVKTIIPVPAKISGSIRALIRICNNALWGVNYVVLTTLAAFRRGEKVVLPHPMPTFPEFLQLLPLIPIKKMVSFK